MAKKKKAGSSKSSPRVRTASRWQERRRAKAEAKDLAVPSGFSLIRETFSTFRTYWRTLGGILLVYLVLNMVLASGLSNVINNFSNIKADLGNSHNISDGLNAFGSLVSSGADSGSSSTSTLQSLLLILISLVIIWSLRNLLAGKKFRVKEAYYQSMTPLVPFVLVIFFFLLQLLPVTIGSMLASLFGSLFPNSGAATVSSLIIVLPLAAWSIYMLSGSIFALYIVTLPGMHPRQALRSSKKLSTFRRFKIVRRLIFLLVFTMVGMAAVMLPLILFAHVLVVPVFYFLSLSILLLVHTYLYCLYRGLLE